VDVADPLPPGTTVDNLEIAGNVAVAGHGSTRPTLTLGSGDATQSRQSFPINVTDVSWVDDTTMPNGVRADLDLTVSGETWTQVGALDQAGATDAVYEVQVREDGSLLIVFGDGTHARRLPTGVNNVAARYRSGVGLAGNLAAGSITKLVAPDALVASVRQPLPAGGGSDREGVDSMRTRAPATVLALGRAVALADFGYLAASQSGVWQARALPATEVETGESVRVVVVAAGGQPMSPTLRTSIQDFLTTRSVPGVRVSAIDYTRVRLSISVILDVDRVHYPTDAVIAAVTTALMQQFTLPARQLGQPVHRSDVFRVVENVAGVTDCECYIADGTGTPDPIARVQRLPAAPTELLTLDADATSLSVTTGPVR
jgi:predicted phage baseplate assembly protein